MRIFTSIRDYKNSSFKSLGVCIGNFDGMHLGHQALFSELKNRHQAEKLFLSFAPHPKKIINKLGADFQELTPLREKAKLAQMYGFDGFLALKFSKLLLELSPREFVKKILVDGLNVSTVVVGYDWHFGKERAGDLDLLKSLGKEFGFVVQGVEKFEKEGQRVSSSQVRKSLTEGDMQLTQKLLGRRFSIGARVIRGDQRGRQLGFPTANMMPKGQLLPARGVYSTIAKIDNRDYPAVSNVGIRPTFSGSKLLLETHVLDRTDLNLYGKCVEISFINRLRKEKKFNSKEELIKQIEQDCIAAKAETKLS